MYQLSDGKNRSGIDRPGDERQRNSPEKNCKGIVEIGMAQAMGCVEKQRQSMER